MKLPRCKEELSGESCPACGCNRIFTIELQEQKIKYAAEPVTLVFAGCPACSWKSDGVVIPEKKVILSS